MPHWFKLSKFFLIVAIVNVVIVTTSTLFPFIVGKYAWFRTSVDLALITFLLGVLMGGVEATDILARLKRIARSPLAIAVTVFVAMFLLACLFGVDPHNSFWSNFERGEGGFQVLHLWIFFALLVALFRTDRDWWKAFGWFMGAGIVMALYGIGAGFQWQGFIGIPFTQPSYRLQGTIGNPAYVATYLLFLLAYTIYFFLDAYRKRPRAGGAIAIIASFVVLLAAFYFAATRGAFVGLIVAALAFLAYFAYSHKAWRKWLIAIGVAMVALVILGVSLKNNPIMQKIPGSRIFDLSFTTQTFHDRTVIWKMAWDGFLARPVFGWGPENFIKVFDTHFNIVYFTPPGAFGAWFDRAHSLIFDYLAETGIIGFLSFAAVFVVFFLAFIKARRPGSGAVLAEKPIVLQALVFAVPFAYLTQGLVLFDVLPTYTNVFFFLALATYLFARGNHTEHKPQS